MFRPRSLVSKHQPPSQHMSCRLTLVDIKRCRNVTITQRWPQRQNLWNLWNMSQNLLLLPAGFDHPDLVSIGPKSDNTLTSAEDFLQLQLGTGLILCIFLRIFMFLREQNTSVVSVHRCLEPSQKVSTCGLHGFRCLMIYRITCVCVVASLLRTTTLTSPRDLHQHCCHL